MKKVIFFPMLFLSVVLYADIKGKVTDAQGMVIPGVNIFWESSTVGTVSDLNGIFFLKRVESTNRLIFSSVSYQNDTITVTSSDNPLDVSLDDAIHLHEVAVVQKRPGVIKSRFAVLQTEQLTADEFGKAACCNLSESFETNPSVDVAYSDAATGAKQIRLLGLSGNYVQMLTENIPNLRGISSVYGLGFIPGPWMEGIQVSKGTGSVINGYEAITGQINVEYKKPQSGEIVAANLFASDAGRMEANVNAGIRLSEYLSTGVLLHASDEMTALDQDEDGYLDMPMVRQLNFVNRWYYKKKGHTLQAFIHALNENRMGGTVDKNYLIDIGTERYEFFLKNGYVFNPEKQTSLGLIISGSRHKQDAGYGLRNYTGVQDNLYANLIFHTDFSEVHKLSAGLSLNYDGFDERLFSYDAGHNLLAGGDTILSRELVSGVFGEYTFNLNNRFIALLGMRADYSSLYGMFVTPRLHLKYTPSDYINFRLTAGKGYRSPNMLAENNFYLASNRQLLIDDHLKMENATNLGLSVQGFIPVFNKELSLTGEWYYTHFDNQVVIDVDSDPGQVHFSNLDGRSYAHSIQLEANMEIFRGFSLTLAQRFNDVQTTIAGVLREKPLTNRYKGLITASYQTPLKKWQFDFTTQFNGGGRMPDPDPVNPLWNQEFPAYTILNTQITKYFRTWSVYLGSENLTNFVQDNPIIDVSNPFGEHFDATNVWGPTHGRKIYLGLRWSLDRD